MNLEIDNFSSGITDFSNKDAYLEDSLLKAMQNIVEVRLIGDGELLENPDTDSKKIKHILAMTAQTVLHEGYHFPIFSNRMDTLSHRRFRYIFTIGPSNQLFSSAAKRWR